MGGLFHRRPRLPADRRPQLERDERVLAWAAARVVPAPSTATQPATPAAETPAVVVEGGTVVATNRGLWLPGTAERLGWHRIHKAVWSGRELTITPAEVVAVLPGYAVVADLPVHSYLLLDPGDVPHQVRTRVTSSVAYSRHHPVPGGGVRVVARRMSGIDGVTWTVRFDPGTELDSPAVQEAVADLLALARTTTPLHHEG